VQRLLSSVLSSPWLTSPVLFDNFAPANCVDAIDHRALSVQSLAVRHGQDPLLTHLILSPLDYVHRKAPFDVCTHIDSLVFVELDDALIGDAIAEHALTLLLG
jgi:hypothetical protein